MPSLVLLGIRTIVAGDDLRVFSTLAMTLRVIEIVLDIPLLVMLSVMDLDVDTEGLNCGPNEHTLTEHCVQIMYSFLILALIAAILQIVNDAWIFRTSGIGTPVESDKRQRCLAHLCAIKFFPHAMLRIVVLALGIASVRIVSDLCFCTDPSHGGEGITRNICPNYYAFYSFLNGLLVTIVIDVCATLAVYTYFTLNMIRPGHYVRSGVRAHHRNSGKSDKGLGWRICCQCCCSFTSLVTCCLLGGTEAAGNDFVGVSLILKDLFDDGGLLDVTISDILNGLVLMFKEQDEERRQMLATTSRRFTPLSISPPGHVYEEEDSALPLSDFELARSVYDSGESHDSNRYEFSYMKAVRDENRDFTCFEKHRRKVLDFTREFDRTAVTEGAHFMKYSLAIYGHLMHISKHGIMEGLCSLGYAAITCKSRRLPRESKMFCSPLRCYSTALVHVADIDPADIVYANYSSGLEKRPYCVIVDKEYSAIVVAVRGTFSLEDAVADLTMQPVSLQDAGERYGFDGQLQFAHAGMFAAAEWLYQDMQRLDILETLLGANGMYPGYGYRLCITGHSLGAGVAAILSIMLHKTYPTLTCLAFEPPGCVLSEKISQQDYIISYVYGCDIVPRLSVSAMEHLRDDVLEMIARIRVPKYTVLLPNPLEPQSSSDNIALLAHERSGIPDSKFYDQYREFRAYHRALRFERGEPQVQLYVPGNHILYLVDKMDTTTSSNLIISADNDHVGTMDSEDSTSTNLISADNVPVIPIWAHREDFLEIHLGSSMLDDHNPDVVKSGLENLVKRYQNYGYYI